jgi:hypothetical protein
MPITTAEIWRDGKQVTHCQVHRGFKGPATVFAIENDVSPGDYEIRNGDAVELVTYCDGQWLPHR